MGISGFAVRATLVIGIVLALSCTEDARGQGQQTPSQSQNQSDPDATQRQVASFDRFLNEHPDVEAQLKANPSLINDPNFLGSQPALQNFLANNPLVRAELEESPIDFVRREDRNATGSGGGALNPGMNEREVGRMDEFLDEHRDVEQQLELNPSLINDPNYLAQHRDLQSFLAAHPQIRQQFSRNPSYFTRRDGRPEGARSGGDQPPATVNMAAANANLAGTNASHDIDGREIGQMDQFLDEHPDTKHSLKQNPLLINDSNYLAQHPELGLFLNAHPRMREDFSEHPERFVQPEKPLEAATVDTGRPKPAPPVVDPNLEFAKQERTRMDQFLDDHSNIAKDLTKNPWLINQSKYLKHHKDLERFLEEHPQIREKVAADPTYFTQRQSGFEHATTGAGWSPARSNSGLNDRDLAEMNEFLVKHKKLAKELERDPALVTSQHYLDHNKDLRRFFEEHPQILVEFRQNPRNFMEREEQLSAQLG